MRLISRPLIASIVTAFFLVGCGADSDKEQSKSAAKSYQFNDQEQSALIALTLDELYNLAAGNDVMAFAKSTVGDYVVTTAHQMQIDYEENEVAGDMKYRKKLVFVTGKVASIDRSVGENYFISLKGGSNPFMAPKANMADGYTEFLAGLTKGETVRLACLGNGMLIGSAMVTKCEPLPNYIATKNQALLKQISSQQVLTGNNTALKQLLVLSVALGPHLSANSACLSSDFIHTKCNEEMRAIFEKEGIKADITAAATKLGQDLDALTGKPDIAKK